MCSVATGQCPSSSVSGWQFNSHYDCVNSGYAIAQKTYRNLKEIEEWDIDNINKNLKSILIKIIKDAGFPELRLEKNINFDELYKQKTN